jgi:natural product biosynthesis luciferase-like monooxygenase protein/non-ribosomal peptide synthase protein (TIGR01720 family)
MDKKNTEPQDKLRESLRVIRKLKTELEETRKTTDPIAVIGIGCRFPGDVTSAESFWEFLQTGKNAISNIPSDRWDHKLFFNTDPEYPGKTYSCSGGFLEDIADFDCQFFGISPIEAESMDPQQRLLLTTTWKAFEHSGIDPILLRGSQTGVYIGMTNVDYMQKRASSKNYDKLNSYDATGNTFSTASGRISYTFDLRGPSLSIDTACSSSLVAIHLASEHLHSGQIDMAIVGGVNLMLEPNAFIIFSKMKALSPRGICSPFDASADGFVRGEGCGVVILKRLRDAIDQGDNILAVVNGSAVNQDGASNGLTAPNGIAQEQLMNKALANARITPNEISYVEAHGTGTPLGDPIEIEAINQVYLTEREKGNTLYVGSLKSNIGHLEGAAGIAGFIKLVLSLSKNTIPPTLNFSTPSPFISWHSDMQIPSKIMSVGKTEKTLRGAISSFGFSGTNAHIIVSEMSDYKHLQNPDKVDLEILTLSAKTENSLSDLRKNFITYLKDTSDPWSSIARASRLHRSHFDHRIAIVADNSLQALSVLQQKRPEKFYFQGKANKHKKITFLFTGQGSQYGGMGTQLYDKVEVFRAAIDECDKISSGWLDKPLKSILNDSEGIHNTCNSQPALFAIEYALFKMWSSFGVIPDAMIGHSIGEYVAACAAGVFSLHDALNLVVSRGKLMQRLPLNGGMTTVFASSLEVLNLLKEFSDEKVSLAAINAPNHIVVSGDNISLLALHKKFDANNIKYKRLKVSHAFHSPLMKDVLDDFKIVLSTVKFSTPRLPIFSNVYGVTQQDALTTVDYWLQHILKPVKFHEATVSAIEGGYADLFLEIGPRPILTNIVSDFTRTKHCIYSLEGDGDDFVNVNAALANLYTRGFPIKWTTTGIPSKRSSAQVPGYAFHKQGFLLESIGNSSARNGHALLGEKNVLAGNTSFVVWNQRINLASLPFLIDHQIENSIVFPAAAYLEMAVSAYMDLRHEFPVQITEIHLEKPLVIRRSDELEIQLQMNMDSKAGYSFAIFSRLLSGKNNQWTKHMVAQIASFKGENPVLPFQVDEQKAMCKVSKQGSLFYEHWNRRGNNWGPAFQGIECLYRGTKEVLSKITVPEIIAEDLYSFQIHPGLMDACGQALAELSETKDGAFVGKQMQSITIFSPFHKRSYWSYAVLRSADDSTNRIATGDIIVSDMEGNLVAQTTGITFEFLSQHQAIEEKNPILHKINWVPADVNTVVEESDAIILFVCSFEVLPDWITEIIKTRGSTSEIVKTQDFAKRAKNLAGNERIVFVSDYHSIERDGFNQAQLDIVSNEVSAFVDFVRQINSMAFDNVLIWIVTTGVWSEQKEYCNLSSSWAWGIGRTLADELPQLWGGIIEVSTDSQTYEIATLIVELVTCSQPHSEFVIRNNTVLSPEIINQNFPDVVDQYQCREDGVYVITGGLGGLGLVMAKWLAEKSAKKIVLISRSGLNGGVKQDLKGIEKKTDIIRTLKSNGIVVDIEELDISDAHAVNEWYQEKISKKGQKVYGLIHAAGTLQIDPLVSVTAKDIQIHYSGKALGAWILHEALCREPLDLFVLFSSASSIISSPGLAAYAAANSFLDALSNYRLVSSMPILNISWSAWAEVGMVADTVNRKMRSNNHLKLLSTAAGLKAMNALVGQTHSQVLVSQNGLSVDKIRNSKVEKGPVPNDYDGIGQNALISNFSIHDLVGWIQDQLSLLLKLDRNSIDEDKALNEFGLDSMLAIELKKKIELDLGITIQVIELIKGPTVYSLATQLCELAGRNVSQEKLLPEIEHFTEEEPYALSHGQMSLWALAKMFPESPSYHVAFSCIITSELDVEVFKRAVHKLVLRHPALMNKIIEESQNKIKQTSRKDFFDLPFEFELKENVKNDDSEYLYRGVVDAYRKAFNLNEGSLFRVSIFKTDEQNYVLLITAHHLVCDGWSLWILLDEIQKIYTAEIKGLEADLPAVKYAFNDYVRWELEMLKGQEGDKLEKYWRSVLEKEIPVLNLPLSFPRSADSSNVGTTYHFSIDRDLADSIRSFSRRMGVTVYMTMLTAFNIVLSRYSRQSDVCVGTPMSGRNLSEFNGVVGDFINLIPIRAQIDADIVFEQLLNQIREIVINAQEHQGYPFSLMVKNFHVGREASVSPFFQVLFNMQQPHRELSTLRALQEGKGNVKWGELTIEPYPISQQEGQFDLTFEFLEGSDEFLGTVKYNSGIFASDMIARMVKSYTILLDHAIRFPGQKVSTLPIISESEIFKITQTWNTTQLTYDREKLIHHCIEEQVVKCPEEIAVVFEDQFLTYRELNDKSNRLAHYLIKEGIGNESRVGICLHRSNELLVSIIAVLKAGATYVPLDPNYPVGRLKYIYKDAGLAAVFTEQGTIVSDLKDGIRYIFLDSLQHEISSCSNTNPSVNISARNLAYIIYTSGSTGEPKGTLIEHRSVVNFFRGMDERLGKLPGVMLAVTTITFDIAVLELLWSLTNGYKVVMLGDGPDLLTSTENISLDKDLDFSLFYFSSEEQRQQGPTNKYNLLLEGAKFADRYGFKAVWTPERHFHSFGGLYPSPTVTSAALSTITKNISIRAGSVVIPLHNPVHVAEEWSIIDNLSNGRVGISFASGWQIDDFVLSPDAYADRNRILFESVDTVRKLWKGEEIELRNGNNQFVKVKIHPRPVQQNLPVWITAAGNPETFEAAGRHGTNLLTHLLGQSISELTTKISLYRNAWKSSGHLGEGHVTVMLHTYIGIDKETTLSEVERPFKDYLKSSLDLFRKAARSFNKDVDDENFSAQDSEAILDHAFKRYLDDGSLIGTPESCLLMLEKLELSGVNEVACLIDFGVEESLVLAGLPSIYQLMSKFKRRRRGEQYTLLRQVAEHKITHLQCTPSLAKVLFGNDKIAVALNGLKKLLLGGEKLTHSLVKQIRPKVSATIFNMYGPTETTIWSSISRIERDDQISIGKPIANTTFYVLDQQQQLVPVGVPGELYIGGEGVARGYLNRESLTLSRFVSDTFSKAKDNKLYRTGDIVRYLDDGAIEYIGREDFQVKLRGHRIELGEVENAILKFPGIKQVVAVVRGDDDSKRIVCYAVKSEKVEDNVMRLRQHALANLPHYMVPSQYIFLDEIPLCSNGKVNIKLLPDVIKEDSDSAFEAPSTRVEKKLAALWGEVLRIDQVGIHDNFFSLGGDSILAIQLVSQAARHGLKFSVNQIFQYQTISGLSPMVSTANSVSFSQKQESGPFALTPIQHWFFEQKLNNPHHYNQSLLIELPSNYTANAVERAVSKLVEMNDSLRMRFSKDEHFWKAQVIENEPHRVSDVVDLRDLSQQEASIQLEQLSEDLQQSLNIEMGPLIKTRCFLLNDTVRMLWVIHHLAIDGISWRILLNDFKHILENINYEAFKPVSFLQWSNKLLEYSLRDDVTQSVDFWQHWPKYYKTIPRLTEDSNANIVRSAKCVVKVMTLQHTHQLLTQATQSFRAGVDEIMLAALLGTIANHAGYGDYLVDIEKHGRETPFEEIDLSQTTGWFTALGPVTFSIEQAFPFEKLIRTVKEHVRRVPRQNTGYFGILKYLHHHVDIRNKLSHIPTSQILFNYLGQFDQSLNFKLATDSIGSNYSSENQRSHDFEIVSFVANNTLSIQWTFSENLHSEKLVNELCEEFFKTLVEVIQYADSYKGHELSVADFPAARLDQADLEKILSKFDN